MRYTRKRQINPRLVVAVGLFDAYGESHGFDANVVSLVNDTAETFISDLLGKLRERSIDLRSGKTLFVGGGSILLRKQIEASSKVSSPIFVEKISANAKGYELLYKASKARG